MKWKKASSDHDTKQYKKCGSHKMTYKVTIARFVQRQKGPVYYLPEISFNRKPHGHGQICPQYFLRPITQKVCKKKKTVKISIPRKTSAESMSWVMYPSKTSVYTCFMPQNRPTPAKCGLIYRPSLMVAAFLPTSRWGVGWQRGVGVNPVNRKKVR
jgi:hypothetical protein